MVDTGRLKGASGGACHPVTPETPQIAPGHHPCYGRQNITVSHLPNGS